MKKQRLDYLHLSWRKSFLLLLVAVLLCVASISFELPKLLASTGYDSSTQDVTKASMESLDRSNLKDFRLRDVMVGYGSVVQGGVANERVDELHDALRRPQKKAVRPSGVPSEKPASTHEYGRIAGQIREAKARARKLSGLEGLAEDAWAVGAKVWRELQNDSFSMKMNGKPSQICVHTILKSNGEIQEGANTVLLPCGLMIGSSITIIGKPRPARLEPVQQIVGARDASFVSQFVVELQGLFLTDGEDPPRILHINPRLKGDWSGKPVIEINTSYRDQWGLAQRCAGWDYLKDDTVDGLPRCENWMNVEGMLPKETRTKRWLGRLIGYSEKQSTGWHYPFSENQTFVLTVRAGWEGYHITVDGIHIASFPFRTGFVLEEATGLSIKGDVDLYSVVATSLPLSHSSALPGKIELSEKWKAPPLPVGPVELFIGILSAGNHFSERMAVRKTWMQSNLITSSRVVARFFVALHHGSNEINAHLLEEAAFYGDMVILPFIDRYELVVLKTVAICDYAVKNLTAKYIMKCDDDNFVRVDAVLYEINSMHRDRGLYMGNMNLYHRPLRLGKWAVTYEEWPEEAYPPYANGPGYVITSDIASFVVSQHAFNALRLFKMEDVSMGMWVVQFNNSHYVNYQHNLKFCQYGCIDDYFTAHYQSPRQMLCLWEKLLQGKAQCCDMKR